MKGVAFVFPGQGSQAVGMGRDIGDASPRWDAATAALGFDLKQLVFEGPEADLTLTANTQPAILATSVVALDALTAAGVRCEFVAGHSLCEYSALVVDADTRVGRRNFPITIGRRASAVLYGVMLALCYGSVVLGVVLGTLPQLALLPLLSAIPAWKAYRGACQNADNIQALIPSMGLNVVVNLAAPVLLAVGLLIA